MISTLVCDFETTVPHDEDFVVKDRETLDKLRSSRTRVWLAATHDMHEGTLVIHHTIDEFLEHLFKNYDEANVYFHNLKFDGMFIITHLMTHLGYTFRNNNELPSSDKYYCGDRDGFTLYNGYRTYNFFDTAKHLTMSVRQMGDMLTSRGMALTKGETPLLSEEDLKRQTREDWISHYDYVKRDVMVLAETMKLFRVHEMFENKYYSQAAWSFAAVKRAGELPELTPQPFRSRFTAKKVKGMDEEYVAGYELVQTSEGEMREQPIMRRRPDHILRRQKAEKEAAKKRTRREAQKHASVKRSIIRDSKVGLAAGIITQRQYDAIVDTLDIKRHDKKTVGANKGPITDEELEMTIRDFKVTGRTPMQQLASLMNIDRESLESDELKRRYDIKREQLRRRTLGKVSRDLAKYSYKGGIAYPSPYVQGQWTGKGQAIDVVSMYPWIYSTMPLPKDIVESKRNIAFDDIDFERLSLIVFRNIKAVCREDSLPLIKPRTDDDRNALPFSDDEIEALDRRAYYTPLLKTDRIILTGHDARYMRDNYDIMEADVAQVYYFDRDYELERNFRRHCEKWIQVKKKAKADGDVAMEIYSKIMLNAPYGKLGNYDRDYDIIAFVSDESGRVTRQNVSSYKGGRQDAEVIAASYITSYGRVYLAETINTIGFRERFSYCDTDSIHLRGWEPLPESVKVGKELGNWDIESYYVKAKYIKSKYYGEEIVLDYRKGDMTFLETGVPKETKWKTVCAGVTKTIPQDEFDIGLHIDDKRSFIVQGGCVIAQRRSEIREIDPAYVRQNEVWMQGRLKEWIKERGL